LGERIFQKLANPAQLNRSPIFVFAADPLAAGGVQGLGMERTPRPHHRTRPEFLQLLREMTADGFIDGLLMTPADAEVLALQEKIFDHSPVTPCVRMNAETGIWSPRHGQYRSQFSLPFQTVPLNDAAYCEELAGAVTACHVRIGLYSITLNNDVDHDERTLNAYLQFAKAVGRMSHFNHFLEVFLPNVNRKGLSDEQCGAYAADSIARTMSYLRQRERPLWIKTEYTTPEIWRQLCEFDPTLIIGALGGPRHSPRRSLQLAHDVISNGGKVILFGRTVFEEDNPRLIAQALRSVLDRAQSVEDAHAEYQRALRQN
jgi:hypothetical protein